ncbi:MAG: hypothetical protein N3C63_12005 [Rhodocyclaceae bacterium]|nr:hypothetical protein [Rhodocyclaceae bacterium]
MMGLLDWLRPAPPLDADTQAGIERAVATVDPLLRQVSGYQEKLAPAVRHALDYCADLAQRIPGPFEISRAAFATDPLVHALFASADDIETMLATSRCVRERLVEMSLGSGECCALLGMRYHEKAGFGARLAGEIVRFDEPQRALYFTDHTLAEPSPDPEAARARLKIAMFDGLLKGFAAHLEDVRAEQRQLAQEQAIEQALVRSRGVDPESHTRRLDELRARLSATASALQPEGLLEALADCLLHPEPHLRLEPIEVCVDRNGILTSAESEAGDRLRFMELTGRDPRRWVVILARIRHEEARRALERIEAARRYIVI